MKDIKKKIITEFIFCITHFLVALAFMNANSNNPHWIYNIFIAINFYMIGSKLPFVIDGYNIYTFLK